MMTSYLNRLFIAVLTLITIAACDQSDPQLATLPGDRMVPLRVSVLNYTDDYIDEVYVDGSWASNMVAHAGGGGVAGSVVVPPVWSLDYKLTIRWRDEPLYQKDPSAYYERKVATEPYQQDSQGQMATLWVSFFPGGVVKLYPAFVGPGHPDFPDSLLAPTFQCRKEHPNSDWCENSGWLKRQKNQSGDKEGDSK